MPVGLDPGFAQVLLCPTMGTEQPLGHEATWEQLEKRGCHWVSQELSSPHSVPGQGITEQICPEEALSSSAQQHYVF